MRDKSPFFSFCFYFLLSQSAPYLLFSFLFFLLISFLPSPNLFIYPYLCPSVYLPIYIVVYLPNHCALCPFHLSWCFSHSTVDSSTILLSRPCLTCRHLFCSVLVWYDASSLCRPIWPRRACSTPAELSRRAD